MKRLLRIHELSGSIKRAMKPASLIFLGISLTGEKVGYWGVVISFIVMCLSLCVELACAKQIIGRR